MAKIRESQLGEGVARLLDGKELAAKVGLMLVTYDGIQFVAAPYPAVAGGPAGLAAFQAESRSCTGTWSATPRSRQ